MEWFENFRYNGINFSGGIQGAVMKEKSILCVLNYYLKKDNVKHAHWVGHLQLTSLDADDSFKRIPIFDEKQAGVTGNTAI